MASLINDTATRENTIKNWDLMTKAAPTKIYVKKYFRFWPFHEIFINRIKNMGWLKCLVFNESGAYYNITEIFGRVQLVRLRQNIRLWKSQLVQTIPSWNSNIAIFTLGFSNQETNWLKISYPKKATSIIKQALWSEN